MYIESQENYRLHMETVYIISRGYLKDNILKTKNKLFVKFFKIGQNKRNGKM